MAASPSISVIIPTYNSAAYLNDSIESVLKQSYPVDEILVVDDGSTDETPSIVSAYSNNGVKYIWQENQGPGAARNLGLIHTRGELVAFLDADDIWMENKTRLQINYLLDHPDVGVVSGQKMWWRVSDDKHWMEYFGNIPESRVHHEILIHNIVGNPSMTLIRRSVLDIVGNYKTNLRWGQDWEIWIRMASCTRFGFVDEPVIIYRAHADNHSKKDPMQRLDCLLGISQNAIGSSKPVWLRPILLSHAKSKTYFFRSIYAIKKPLPRKQQISYALAAFFLYPWDDMSLKFRTVVRALVSDRFYQKQKNRFRKWFPFLRKRRDT